MRSSTLSCQPSSSMLMPKRSASFARRSSSVLPMSLPTSPPSRSAWAFLIDSAASLPLPIILATPRMPVPNPPVTAEAVSSASLPPPRARSVRSMPCLPTFSPWPPISSPPSATFQSSPVSLPFEILSAPRAMPMPPPNIPATPVLTSPARSRSVPTSSSPTMSVMCLAPSMPWPTTSVTPVPMASALSISVASFFLNFSMASSTDRGMPAISLVAFPPSPTSSPRSVSPPSFIQCLSASPPLSAPSPSMPRPA